jgi:hypothetical protein
VTGEAPPGRSGALRDAGGTVGLAALGASVAFLVLVAICQVLATIGSLLVGAFGLWSWAKLGLLTTLASLRADVVATVHGPPLFPMGSDPVSVRSRFVPMLLTMAFLWMTARAGRRAAGTQPDRSPVVTAGLVAVGAGVPAALLAALCSLLVTVSFPALGLRLTVDVWTAALWAGVLASAGAAAGGYLTAARGRPSAAALRGGLTAYGSALGLLALAVFVLATLEPTVTRDYVDAMADLGAGGGVLFGYHLLGFPAQSALVLAPASGSCLAIVGEGPLFDLCPWSLAPGPAGAPFLPTAMALSPWLWLLNVVPLIAAMLGGWRAANGANGAVGAGFRTAGMGVAAGVIFALLALLGGWFAAPRVPDAISPPGQLSLHPAWARTAIATLAWGIAGGGTGAWLAARRYAEPELPRPTSA